jgi:hypothetical protein
MEIPITQQPDTVFALLRQSVSEMKSVLDHLSEATPAFSGRAAEFKEALFCLNLGLLYYEEANRAIQGGAWFAGSTVAAAALEATLMSKCLTDRDAVRSLPKWKTLKKSYRENFSVFVRSLDLGKLLEIAKQLRWFPSGGIPVAFRDTLYPCLDCEAIALIESLFVNDCNAGQVCADHVREYRNLLHPAVCLREDHLPTTDAGKMATLVFLIAFTSLAAPAGGTAMTTIEEIPRKVDSTLNKLRGLVDKRSKDS